MSETIMGIYCVNFRSITPILYFLLFFLSRGHSPLKISNPNKILVFAQFFTDSVALSPLINSNGDNECHIMHSECSLFAFYSPQIQTMSSHLSA